MFYSSKHIFVFFVPGAIPFSTLAISINAAAHWIARSADRGVVTFWVQRGGSIDVNAVHVDEVDACAEDGVVPR